MLPRARLGDLHVCNGGFRPQLREGVLNMKIEAGSKEGTGISRAGVEKELSRQREEHGKGPTAVVESPARSQVVKEARRAEEWTRNWTRRLGDNFVSCPENH